MSSHRAGSVAVNGGLISLDDLKESAPAIINAGMPGVQGGTAFAATVFGENNPGGKLIATMYHFFMDERNVYLLQAPPPTRQRSLHRRRCHREHE